MHILRIQHIIPINLNKIVQIFLIFLHKCLADIRRIFS
uniref:Uncharacterized protein n=1 Tax=Setaria italica TaxID=4555 RepID=K3XTF7_SETIT